VSLAHVRETVGRGAVVQGRGDAGGTNAYRSFEIRLRELDPRGQAALTRDLRRGLHAQVDSVKNVSASFSRQILVGALWSIAGSFALIALYVSARYRWRLAVPILRTLVNDIPIALGVYALSGREVAAATVAAMLTILGYSVYDTIIVFDRVRENLRRMPRATIGEIANASVSEVLRRSAVTTAITLVPVLALFQFGGATLRDFAFAILVGVGVGAVSTLFVATPLLVGLLERAPMRRSSHARVQTRPR
jgi:SecD/SecF fusion protein